MATKELRREGRDPIALQIRSVLGICRFQGREVSMSFPGGPTKSKFHYYDIENLTMRVTQDRGRRNRTRLRHRARVCGTAKGIGHQREILRPSIPVL